MTVTKFTNFTIIPIKFHFRLLQKYLTTVMMLLCVTAIYSVRSDDEKQIKLSDIENDTLLHETERGGDDANAQKELAPEPTQHIQLSYSNNPQDVFVTPSPRSYGVKGNNSLTHSLSHAYTLQ